MQSREHVLVTEDNEQQADSAMNCSAASEAGRHLLGSELAEVAFMSPDCEALYDFSATKPSDVWCPAIGGGAF